MPAVPALIDAGLPSPARGVYATRIGGTSLPPYDALNVAYHVGDDWDHAFANRGLLAAAVGLPYRRHSYAQQVHGSGVLVVPAERVGANALLRGARGVDALVTTALDAPLVVMVADCVPVLMADAPAGVVAVAHAGRAGLVAGVAARTVDAMVSVGADPARIVARLGPSICASCYELPQELVAAVDAAVPGTRATTRDGAPSVDVAGGVAGQLRAAGVTDISTDPACTREDGRFFSHRRDGVTGRFAAVAWLGR